MLSDVEGPEYQSKEETLERLRQNSEKVTSLRLHYVTHDDVNDYGKALTGNTVVEALHLCSLSRSFVNDQNLSHNFLSFISRSKHLKKVRISSGSLGERLPQNVVVDLLMALSENSSIRHVKLENIDLPFWCLNKLLCSALSSATLVMQSTTIVNNGVEHDCIERTFSSAGNPSIQDLRLLEVDQESVIKMLHVGFISQIRKLRIVLERREMAEALAKQLKISLSRMHALDTIHFEGVIFQKPSFELLASGLVSSKSLRKVVVSCCKFDVPSTRQFSKMFQDTDCNIACLDIRHGRHQFTKATEIVATEIMESPSSLKELNLSYLTGFVPKDLKTNTVFRPLEEGKSKLQCLHLGILYQSCLADLLSGISRSRDLQEIRFHVQSFDHFDHDKTIESIVNAVKKNCSLENVIFPGSGTEIEYLCKRNRDIRCWISAWEGVPIEFWPFVFASALQYEYRCEIIFKMFLLLVHYI